MYTFVAKDAEVMVLYGDYEDVEEPSWAGLNWPIYMVCTGKVISHILSVCKTISPTLAMTLPKSVTETAKYYFYPAETGFISDFGQVPTGLNFKIFDEYGRTVSSDKGVSFELIKSFSRILGKGRDEEVGLLGEK